MNPRRTQIIELDSTDSRMAFPGPRSNAVSPGRLRRRRRAGFTLIELMVALTVGGLAVTTFYTVARHTTLFFQEQSRVSNLQDHMRVAMAQIKRDIKRAGYLAPANNRLPSTMRCVQPGPALVPGAINPGAIVLNNRNIPANAVSGIDPGGLYGANPAIRVDQLALLANYETGATYAANFNPLQPATIRLNAGANNYAALRDFGDWANGLPANLDVASLNAAFAVGRPIVMEGAGGMRHYATINGIVSGAFNTGGGVTFTFTPPAVGAGGPCAVGGGWVAPLQTIEYTVLSAASAGTAAAAANAGLLLDPDETLPQLHRREFNLQANAAMAGGEDRTILDYVVAFHVDLISDGATVVTTDPDVIDWVAAANPAVNRANASPETVRGARILLAARVSGHDRSLSPVGVGPLQVFQIDNARRGGARVRTLRADIFIPNLALQ